MGQLCLGSPVFPFPLDMFVKALPIPLSCMATTNVCFSCCLSHFSPTLNDLAFSTELCSLCAVENSLETHGSLITVSSSSSSRCPVLGVGAATKFCLELWNRWETRVHPKGMLGLAALLPGKQRPGDMSVYIRNID